MNFSRKNTAINSSAVSINSMQFAWQGMTQSAQQIAPAGTTASDCGVDIKAALAGNVNTVEPMISPEANLQLFYASAKMFDTADSRVANLMDIRS